MSWWHIFWQMWVKGVVNMVACILQEIMRYSQVGMNGDTFSIKEPEECSEKFAATFKGNSLPEEMFLEYYLCS